MYGTRQRAKLGHLLTIPLLVIFGLVSCGTPPPPTGSLTVIRVSHTASVQSPGQLSVSASCDKGQQLLGGGYEIIQSRTTQWPLVVEGSYPASLFTWVALVFNPDNPDNVVHRGIEVTAYAYCATNPNLPLGIKIESSPHTVIEYRLKSTESYALPPNDPFDLYQFFASEATAVCPRGSVLTGGGFVNQFKYPPIPITQGVHKIEGVHEDHPLDSKSIDYVSIESAPVPSSIPFPSLDSPRWVVSGVDTGATLTAYALCATTRNISSYSPTPQEVKEVGAAEGWRYYGLTISCQRGEFATGGGYIFPNSEYRRQVFWPKAAWRDMIHTNPTGWDLDVGYQIPTSNDDIRYDQTHPLIAGTRVYGLCLKKAA